MGTRKVPICAIWRRERDSRSARRDAFAKTKEPFEPGSQPQTKKRQTVAWRLVCGERGIRTPGTFRYGGFQDRCNRPLYHLSGSFAGAKVNKKYD